MDVKEVLKVRKYKAGYEIRTELVDAHFEDKPGETMEMKNAYTPNGEWIGDSKLANFLCRKLGIAPEKKRDSVTVCSIGFCEKDNKWYGWSHRAIVGFSIGDRIFEEKYGDEDTLFVEHGTEEITNLEDAKKSAIAFSDYVS